PVQVESVAWISERKNLLSGFFYLLSLTYYLRFSLFDVSHAASPKSGLRYYAAALGFFTCALLSKSVVCSLPVTLLLLLWWKKEKIEPRDFFLLTPMFVVGGISSALTAALEWDPVVVGTTGQHWDFTIAERLTIAGKAFWFYLYTLLWPAN